MSDESNTPKRRRTASPRVKTSYMACRDGAEPAADDPLLGFAPVPHKQLHKNSLNPARQRAFIAALAATGIVTDAAKAVGASQEAFYRLRNQPGAEQFRAAWEEAVDRAIARVEDRAVQRAIEGAERPIVSGGKLLGWYRVHNEALVMFLLRRRRGERYGVEPPMSIRPGHPVYEQVRRELWRAEPDIEEVRAEILRKVAAIERARAQNRTDLEAVLAEADLPEEPPAE